MSFHSEYSKPTDAQYQAIGRVTANWAIMEFSLEVLLSRLAMAPSFPALALTYRLGIDNRLESLKNLVTMHRTRYQAQIVPQEILTELANVPKEIAKLKSRRNQVAHYVWFRLSDQKMFGHRFAGKQAVETQQTIKTRRKQQEQDPTDYEEGSSVTTTVGHLEKFASKIMCLSDRISDLCGQIPEIDEEQLARSLARRRHRRPDVR